MKSVFHLLRRFPIAIIFVASGIRKLQLVNPVSIFIREVRKMIPISFFVCNVRKMISGIIFRRSIIFHRFKRFLIRGTIKFQVSPHPSESQRQKTYLQICELSEDSDQPVHSHSLIRIFTGQF